MNWSMKQTRSESCAISVRAAIPIPKTVGMSLIAPMLVGIFAIASQAAIPPGCSATTDAEYKTTTLVNRTMGINEPIKMDFDQVAKDQVDIYWVERMGKVKKFAAATGAVIELGTIIHNDDFESGVTGILLDRGFKSNTRMFIYYAFGSLNAFEFRLSRFALGADGKLDLASEKIVLRIPATFHKMHTGGAMAWGDNGNLYITVGENEAGMGGPANTNDLRGKILRIHPEEDGTYTVPEGNLFPKGTAKTKPEIYVMGNRNPYSITYDPVLKAAVWGEVGPDGTGVTEEDNIAATPGNYGWPMWSGNQVALKTPPGDPNAPKNTDAANTGLVDLPASRPGTYSYPQSCAITGPIYRYDGALDSKRKFPPHWDGKWFVTDCNNGEMDTLNLNAKNDGITTHARFFAATRLVRPLDMKFGPDGALYVLNYAGWFSAEASTSIQRIEYTGSCLPAATSTIRFSPSDLQREAVRQRVLSLLRHDGQALIPWEGFRLLNGRAAGGVGR